MKGLKDGILLEVGFDDVTPNIPTDISSWAYDFAADKVQIIDNRAKGVAVTIPATRWWKNSRQFPRNTASSRKPARFR